MLGIFIVSFVFLFLCLSVSTLYLYISPKPNLTLIMPACCPTTLSLTPSLSLYRTPPSLSLSLSHPLRSSCQIRNSLLRLILVWTNSFIIKICVFVHDITLHLYICKSHQTCHTLVQLPSSHLTSLFFIAM